MTLIRPTPDLAQTLREELAASADDRLAAIGMERVRVGPGALERLPDDVRDVAGHGPVVVLEDATSMRRGDADLKATVAGLLDGLAAVRVVLGPDDGQVHADAETLARAAAAADGAGCVVSVGSGTITDIAKHVCHRLDLPLVAVQTAVSVNGFSDDMSVILKDGVKRTVGTKWVDVLIVDTDVIRSAPQDMNRSGVGELMAMFTAPADWRLASYASLDDSFSAAAVELFRRHGDTLLAIEPGIDARDGDALDELAVIMTASGVALGVAGRTAPLSGTEHMVSHMLDMAAGARGGAVGLHGAQVGVAAVVAACLWEHALARLDPERLLDDASFPRPDDVRARIEGAFAHLDPTGALARECWADYRDQLAAWDAARPQLAILVGNWPIVVDELRGLLGDPAAMVAALRAAGAPTRFAELGVPVDEARWAVAHCHLMRNRFTVADLAYLTGHWEPDDVETVLARAGELGGGL